MCAVRVWGWESDSSAGVGSGCVVVAVSACMSGTCGSADVLVRGVGGVCDMCTCLARGGVGGEGGEWMRELGLGGGLDRGLGQGSGAVGWCYVCVRCESGFSR